MVVASGVDTQHSSISCSLNGRRSAANLCVCTPPWEGADCGRLAFAPAPPNSGYTAAGGAWGGEIVAGADGKHHLYAAAMSNGCFLKHWGGNSRVEHAVSSAGAAGPYAFESVAVDVEAHNPAAIAMTNTSLGYKYAIFHIGAGVNGTDGGSNCTSDAPCCQPADGGPGCAACVPPRPPRPAVTSRPPTGGAGSSVHVSDSLSGPWRPLPGLTGAASRCNNPAPALHHNGSLFLMCTSSTLLRSEHGDPAGPWSTVGSLNRSAAPVPHLEDASLWVAEDGAFHALFHAFAMKAGELCWGKPCDPLPKCAGATVSAHAFSADGIAWRWSGEQPYDNEVLLAGGGSKRFATRERPKLLLGADGVPTHLTNGVVDVPYCGRSNSTCAPCKTKGYETRTLVVPLALKSDDATAPPATVARTPPMGWSSWNAVHGGINEAVITNITDALVSTGLAAAGYVYVNLDDCVS